VPREYRTGGLTWKEFAPSDEKVLPLRIETLISMHGRPTCPNLVQSDGTKHSSWQFSLIAVDASALDGLERKNVDTWNFQYSANPFLG
jgi:hypothetical protein